MTRRRRRPPAILSIVAIAALAGSCGPKSGRSWVALGDSITVGMRVQVPYPRAISQMRGVTVENLAFPGVTSAEVLETWRSHARRHTHPVVLVLAGVNDLASDVPIEDTKKNLSAIWAGADAQDAKLIAMTIAPWKGSRYWTPERQRRTDELNAWIRSRALQPRVLVDLGAALGDPLDSTTLASAYDSGDHVHPNQAGCDRIAAAILDAALPAP